MAERTGRDNYGVVRQKTVQALRKFNQDVHGIINHRSTLTSNDIRRASQKHTQLYQVQAQTDPDGADVGWMSLLKNSMKAIFSSWPKERRRPKSDFPS